MQIHAREVSIIIASVAIIYWFGFIYIYTIWKKEEKFDCRFLFFICCCCCCFKNTLKIKIKKSANNAGLYCAATEYEVPDLRTACWDFVERCVQRGHAHMLVTSGKAYLGRKQLQKLSRKVRLVQHDTDQVRWTGSSHILDKPWYNWIDLTQFHPPDNAFNLHSRKRTHTHTCILSSSSVFILGGSVQCLGGKGVY